jgi:hypothetical protein
MEPRPGIFGSGISDRSFSIQDEKHNALNVTKTGFRSQLDFPIVKKQFTDSKNGLGPSMSAPDFYAGEWLGGLDLESVT